MSNASQYFNAINTLYPVRGQDNDSQGFRDNFGNIKGALVALDNSSTYVFSNAVFTNESVSNFQNHTIQSAFLSGCGLVITNYNEVPYNFNIDCSQGNYQIITVDPGTTTLNFINFDTQNATTLMLSVKQKQQISSCSLFFQQAQGVQTYTLNANTTTNLFRVYIEPTPVTQVFVESLTATTTYNIASNANQYTLTSPVSGQSLQLSVATNEGSYWAAQFTSLFSGETYNRTGNIALLPALVLATVTGIQSAGVYNLATANGIKAGAYFYYNFGTGNVKITVLSVNLTTNQITVDDTTQTPNIGAVLSIINNSFQSAPTNGNTSQPIIFQQVTTASGTSTGQIGVFAGSIYADANNLEVTYADPTGSTNTFRVSTLANSNNIQSNDASLATTQFVHSILPYGTILMWHGTSANVPAGWNICDGSNGTPDLRARFIVGADAISTATATIAVSSIGQTSNYVFAGGSTRPELPLHNHPLSTVSVDPFVPNINFTDPGHFHTFQVNSGYVNNQQFTGSSNSYQGARENTDIAFTGITVQGAITTVTSHLTISFEEQTTGWGNIPPFYALCYIMKITGGP